jgi:hypothetical protein
MCERGIDMRAIRVLLADNTDYVTDINGTNKEIEQYFVGQELNMGSGENDRMVKCVGVEFLDN